jgi:hypothetical protein
MSVDRQSADVILRRLLQGRDASQLRNQIGRRMPADVPLPPRLPTGYDLTKNGIAKRPIIQNMLAFYLSSFL